MPTDQSESSQPPEPEPRCTSTISLTDQTRSLPPDAIDWLKQRSAQALHALNLIGELSIKVVNDHEMAIAHQSHKGVQGTTDVLTFDLAQPDAPKDTIDADILICIDEAKRQADARAHTIQQELLLYIVHAILHCAGHNDDNQQNADAMHIAEDNLLTTIGVQSTYKAQPVRAEGR